MMIQASTYWAGGKTPIASVEFCAFECTVGELQLLQTGGVEAMCASRVFEGRGDEIERLTLPLALAAQLRVAQRVAEQWRDEFDEWVAFPPYSVPPPEPTETPSVALNLGAWCDAIGAGIKHIVLDEVLQCGSHPRADASETIVNKDQPSRPLAQRLKRRALRILRGFNRPRRRD